MCGWWKKFRLKRWESESIIRKDGSKINLIKNFLSMGSFFCGPDAGKTYYFLMPGYNPESGCEIKPKASCSRYRG